MRLSLFLLCSSLALVASLASFGFDSSTESFTAEIYEYRTGDEDKIEAFREKKRAAINPFIDLLAQEAQSENDWFQSLNRYHGIGISVSLALTIFKTSNWGLTGLLLYGLDSCLVDKKKACLKKRDELYERINRIKSFLGPNLLTTLEEHYIENNNVRSNAWLDVSQRELLKTYRITEPERRNEHLTFLEHLIRFPRAPLLLAHDPVSFRTKLMAIRQALKDHRPMLEPWQVTVLLTTLTTIAENNFKGTRQPLYFRCDADDSAMLIATMAADILHLPHSIEDAQGHELSDVFVQGSYQTHPGLLIKPFLTSPSGARVTNPILVIRNADTLMTKENEAWLLKILDKEYRHLRCEYFGLDVDISCENIILCGRAHATTFDPAMRGRLKVVEVNACSCARN